MKRTDLRPCRIQLKRRKGWKLPENAVKVDRSTIWGNPYIVGKHGTLNECMDMYMKLITGYICVSMGNTDQQFAHMEAIKTHINKLKGKHLACWCPLHKPCHANALLLIANSEGKLNIDDFKFRQIMTGYQITGDL